MKTFIKLLLLVAVALPAWLTTAAQEVTPQKEATQTFLTKQRHVLVDGAVHSKKASSAPKKSAPRKKVDANAPAIFVKVDKSANNESTVGHFALPFNGDYCDNTGTESQMIYSADKLSEMGIPPGSVIKSFSFFVDTQQSASGIPSDLANATYQVRIGQTEGTSISSHDEMIDNRNSLGDPVFSGKLTAGATIVTFTLPTPIRLEEGKGLIIDTYVYQTASDWGNCYWLCEELESSCSYLYCYYTSEYSINSATPYLPKIQIDYETWSSAEEIDFGAVLIDATKTMEARINNPGEVALTANMSATQPFGVSPTTLSMEPGLTDFTLTFTPTQAINYTGKLNLEINGQTASVDMKGVGYKPGEKAIRDKAFFEDIEYEWKDENGNTHTNNLADIATDPDQIIAMLKEVYTNKSIPGNYKRGYSSSGGSDHDDDVTYTGIGRITSSTATECNDSYGWGIPGTVLSGTSDGYSYRYMDPDQYKPDQEGVTLLLLEIVDTFTPASTTLTGPTHTATELRGYVKSAIKSARVVTDAKRVGDKSDFSSGTLFKIDCDKMNKFYLIAKGQLSWHKQRYRNYKSSNTNTFYNFYGYPMYYGNYYLDYGLHSNYLNTSPALLCHMFEQLSPSEGNASNPLSDGYKMFVTEMKSFGIIHDCPNVPYVNTGHHFMMYGQESAAADCQDIRDMMFLVPDYRMMDWTGRGTSGSSGSNRLQDYFYYHENHKPTMGVFVIHQDEVEEVTKTDDYYMLKLTWDSNLDEFLPADQQEYQLWQVVIDEFGVSHYEQVYYMNENGEYTDAEGNVVNTPVPIVLERSASADKKTYNHVYVKRDDSSKTVTYAVRGQDKGHFLSLQMSNEQSYFIQGKDPAEVAMMSSATVYSRFEAQAVRNCYSNKLKITSSPRSIKTSYLPNESEMSIVRSHVLNNGSTSQPTYVNETVATLTINTATKKFTVTGPVMDDVSNLFPVGPHDGKIAGYHANKSSEIDYTTDGEYINFDIELWDNFVVDVSANEHPGLYTYQLKFSTPSDVAIVGTENGHEAYSNPIPVLVYKTDSKINKPLTLAQVNGDTSNNPDYSPGDVEFGAQVQLSSKTEILRYDAYRWNEGVTRSIIDYGGETDEDEEDYDPNGIAGNQGESYSVSMNAIGTADYYVGDEVPVTTGAPRNWVTFVDYYPTNLETGGAYTYAPVVELFTRGYQAGSTTLERGDYNTYGGPLKNTAVGKMTLQIDPELNSDQAHSFMSTYKWQEGDDENTKWYCYYDIPIKFTLLDVPGEYEIYKVRAWREVADARILGEEYQSRAGRKVANYLFEEMNFGDDMGGGVTMSKDNLFRKATGASSESYSYAVGSRNPQVDEWFSVNEPTIDIEHETHATFGALRINTKDGEPYSMNELNATFKVRAYFVKKSDANGLRNPLVSVPTRDDVANPADFDYYIAEGEIEFKSAKYSNIITGVNAVKMDVNREVVSVSYVNTIGQVSSTPWQGINMVVTRYSDGSTTTKKVLK